jgi:hypothetical protein
VDGAQRGTGTARDHREIRMRCPTSRWRSPPRGGARDLCRPDFQGTDLPHGLGDQDIPARLVGRSRFRHRGIPPSLPAFPPSRPRRRDSELRLPGTAKGSFTAAPVGSVTNRPDLWRSWAAPPGDRSGALLHPHRRRKPRNRRGGPGTLGALAPRDGDDAKAERRKAAAGREGLYLPVNHAWSPSCSPRTFQS